MIDYTYFQKQLEQDYTQQTVEPVVNCIKVASSQLTEELRSCKHCSPYDIKRLQHAVKAIEREVLSHKPNSRVLFHMLKRVQNMVDSIKKTPEVLMAYIRWQSLVEMSIKSSLV
ncbi:hypothetical protein [Jeotgalibacillus proteolyticus]|uniref:Uncharacterized protein n=1 Tax=Jeotgalibacillus proteolyticus TaxID=2082395 RepID=A0A2S5GD74_9BACL|nr:hypothetical protein [Jeotgalibacillus proteolyticus]PPA70946.1 hypothetical protein C4B60_09185 [Jeotgalibacillus proteolyticus]